MITDPRALSACELIRDICLCTVDSVTAPSDASRNSVVDATIRLFKRIMRRIPTEEELSLIFTEHDIRDN